MIIACILFLLTVPMVQAHLPDLPWPYGLQVDVNLIKGRTVGPYEEGADGTAYGVNLNLGRLTFPMVQVGVDIEYLVTSKEARDVSIAVDGAPAGYVSLRTRNSVLSPSAVVRVQPVEGAVRPYVQTYAGIRLLSTWMTDTDREETDSQAVDRATFNDVALAIGIRAGINIEIWRTETETQRAYLHLGRDTCWDKTSTTSGWGTSRTATMTVTSRGSKTPFVIRVPT